MSLLNRSHTKVLHRHTLLGVNRGHTPFHPGPVIQVDTYRNGVEESHVRGIGTKHSGQAGHYKWSASHLCVS